MPYRVPFEVPHLSYAGAIKTLNATKRFGIQPLLESVSDMLIEAGNPDLAYDNVQIAGTNGKTSTARYTAALLMGEGKRTALYTSPELVHMPERMEVQGKPISRDLFAWGISVATTAARRVNARRCEAHQHLYDVTEFDLLTVGALATFAHEGVEVAVLECGMGGRWDATSASKSIKSVGITGIGMDHMAILGDTLEKIAGEKAAIIKPGRSCVLGVGTATPDSVEDVFLNQARAAHVTPLLLRPEKLSDAAGEMHPGTPRPHKDLPHASYRIVDRPDRLGGPLILNVDTPRAHYQELGALKPAYQAANIAEAICLAENYLDRALDPDKAYDSIVSCPTPGRLDLVKSTPVVLVDACHNPQSVDTFLTAMDGMEPDVDRRPQLLCAVLKDKDVEGIVKRLAPAFPSVSVTQTSSPRALPAEELGKVFEENGMKPKHVFVSVSEAVKALSNESYVACGSITTAGEVAGLVCPKRYEP
jgi:dihydrofolate synthase/folylpolyglutamate synthase